MRERVAHVWLDEGVDERGVEQFALGRDAVPLEHSETGLEVVAGFFDVGIFEQWAEQLQRAVDDRNVGRGMGSE